MASQTSRYLDVMTVRPSQAAALHDSKTPHSSLLIEPILMPNLQHIEIAVEKKNRIIIAVLI